MQVLLDLLRKVQHGDPEGVLCSGRSCLLASTAWCKRSLGVCAFSQMSMTYRTPLRACTPAPWSLSLPLALAASALSLAQVNDLSTTI